VRFTPTLAFIRDTVPDAAHRMEELLAKARAADADVARIREGAVPAGDAQPYRVTEDDGTTADDGAMADDGAETHDRESGDSDRAHG
jgi:ribosome-binding factor A